MSEEKFRCKLIKITSKDYHDYDSYGNIYHNTNETQWDYLTSDEIKALTKFIQKNNSYNEVYVLIQEQYLSVEFVGKCLQDYLEQAKKQEEIEAKKAKEKAEKREKQLLKKKEKELKQLADLQAKYNKENNI